MSRAIAKVNNTWIDGKQVTVSKAKFSKPTGVPDSQRHPTTLGPKKMARKEAPIYDNNTDGRSYKDVAANSKPKKTGTPQDIDESTEEGQYLMNSIIPPETIDWILASSTGIIKNGFDIEFVQRALASDGICAKVASWGSAPNVVLVSFPSKEIKDGVWRETKSELAFWFQFLEEDICIDGTPYCYCSVSLSGFPLLCWYDSFFTQLANRWGKLIHISEGTSTKSDLSLANLLIRVRSQYGVPRSLKILVKESSYFVEVNTGLPFFLEPQMSDSPEVEAPAAVSPLDGCFAAVAEDERLRPDRVSREADSPLETNEPENQEIQCHMNPPINQGSHVSCDPPATNFIPPVFSVSGVHSQKNVVNSNNGIVNQGLDYNTELSPQTANLGHPNPGLELPLHPSPSLHEPNVNEVLGHEVSVGSTLMSEANSLLQEIIPDSLGNSQDQLEIIETLLSPTDKVQAIVSPRFPMPQISVSTSNKANGNFFNSEVRRAIRSSIRDSIEREDMEKSALRSVPSANSDHISHVEEALAVWGVSNILGISFVGGKEALVTKVVEIEKGSNGDKP
ncbi:hypothetical protein HRI_002356000 [Hibiscus trionum]|uniref:DUF4283 domain-containing protein n=1 Tax=Hibiscus trionum TaxID=183268 RepID=A0A9W7M285_HIBTR|nr:hypothetical protein HRI_002356000 [Hibiscus trionum]